MASTSCRAPGVRIDAGSGRLGGHGVVKCSPFCAGLPLLVLSSDRSGKGNGYGVALSMHASDGARSVVHQVALDLAKISGDCPVGRTAECVRVASAYSVSVCRG
jgi:hypothetical protein